MDEWMQRGGSYGDDFVRTLDENFGPHARQRRIFLQYSQDVVATLLVTTYGIKWHQTVVAKVESGVRQVKLAEAYALAEIYGLPLEDLAYGKNLDHVWHYRREERDGRMVTIGKRAPRTTEPLNDEAAAERDHSMAYLAQLESELIAVRKRKADGEHPEEA
jgi:hypothetical protein